MWPTLWSITIATPVGLPDFYTIFLFVLGAFIMRSAGCVINDILDKDIDKKVKRTKDRPLAGGKVTVAEAWTIFVFLMAMGLLVLLQLNRLAIILGFLIVVPIMVYPLMKRFFAWPQLFLALVFNWGVLIAWAYVGEELSLSTLILYMACMCWTIGYDTIYAHQDKDYDKKIGIKSTALVFVGRSKTFIGGFYAVMIGMFVVLGILNDFSKIYYAGTAIAALHLFLQVKTVKLDDAKNCMDKFNSNISFGWVVFLTFVIEKGVQL